MVNGVPPYHQLDIDVFRVLMKTAPDKYCCEVPVTDNMNLNAFIRSCLNINYAKRSSVQQLLQSKFIVKAPIRCAQRTSDVPISTFLHNKEMEAQRYANSIISGNLQLWLADKAHAKRMNNEQSSMSVIPIHSTLAPAATQFIPSPEGAVRPTGGRSL